MRYFPSVPNPHDYLLLQGHETLILTAHHDPSHCFRETTDGQCEVRSRGDWLPR